MASSGKKISSLSVTYEEKYLGSSWPKSGFGGQQCRSLDYQNAATVPEEVSVTELCDHLQPEELYEEDTAAHQQVCHYDSQSCQEPGEHSNGYLLENQHSVKYSEPATDTVEPNCEAHPRSRHYALHVLEDQLRHRVNVSIEDFRAHIQEVFYEQFSVYRDSVIQEHTRNHPHTYTCEESEGSFDSACTHESSFPSVDSGVSGVESDEQSINYCLIKLQMCAAAITSNLQRAEYSIT